MNTPIFRPKALAELFRRTYYILAQPFPKRLIKGCILSQPKGALAPFNLRPQAELLSTNYSNFVYKDYS
jgi:hypothetical protein